MKKKLATIKKKLEKYEKGELALTKTQLSDLWKDHHKLVEDIKRTCKHETIELFIGSWVDQGYGCDRHYDEYGARCPSCSKYFFGEYLDNPRVYARAPATKIVESYKNRLSQDQINKLGVRIVTHTTTTYEYKNV